MKRWLTICIWLSVLPLTAQNDEIDLEQFAERLFQVQDENIAYEDIYESLLLFYTNKLNLNKVQPSELASLYILNPSQITDFFNYRLTYGDFISINELQVIPSFDMETIRLLLPFVTVRESIVDSRPFFQRILQEENNYLLLRYTRRLEEQVGYTPALPLDTTIVRDENDNPIDTLVSAPTRYQGSPDKIYGRFRTSRRGDFSLGFTFEKDNGEAFGFNENRNGFDFYSYHLLLEDKFGFDQIILGDFQVQMGQGVIFGAGFNAGKGAETVNTTKRNSLGLRPYTSVLEAGFFRGIGFTRSYGKLKATVFYSRLDQDGAIRTDTTFSAFDEFVNSIQNDGFHRTENELAKKDQIVEESIGAAIEFRPNRKLQIGVTGLNSNYSIPLQRTPNNYNQFEFKGDHNYVASIFGNYLWQNFFLFGEVARSKSGGIGSVGGIMGTLSKSVDLAIVLRNYQRDFHSFYGNAFSENSRNINEKGVYWGLAITPSRRHKINLYYDQFKFPWLRFGTEAPSVGNEWLVRYTHRPNRQVAIYTQVRQQTRQVSIPQENLNVLTEQIRYNYLFNVDYTLSSKLSLKTKVQSSHQKEGETFTKGFVILQDVNFSLWKLKFHTRMALFETDDFDNAQYVYESDVLYAFSIPAYNGTGIRTYAMVRYDPFKRLALWVRYARLTFRDRDSIGSGLEESTGNTSSEIKLMARVKF